MNRVSMTISLAIAALLTGCSIPPDSAYHNRGGPETLLDVSSEVVNLSVAGKSEIKELSNWIANDQPTRAELFCDATAASCKDAQKALQAKGVETNITPSMNNTVTLVYERILARDCNQRYIDNGTSLYNELSPTVGCSIAANMVQQVSDKRQFVNPNLSDNPSARGAINNFIEAYKPKNDTQKYGVTSSVASGSGAR